jgi:hypothetical protein
MKLQKAVTVLVDGGVDLDKVRDGKFVFYNDGDNPVQQLLDQGWRAVAICVMEDKGEHKVGALLVKTKEEWRPRHG